MLNQKYKQAGLSRHFRIFLTKVVCVIWMVFAVAFATNGCLAAVESVLLSANGANRATAYTNANKIISYGDKTHVSWLDANMNVRIRTLDHSTGQWSANYTLGVAQDNHGGPALTIDSQGYLHAVYYPHHDLFRYRKSVRPNDASQWEDEILVGNKCTYPTLVVGPDDTLYLTARENVSNAPWHLDLYTKPADGSWSKQASLIEANDTGYSHLTGGMAWGPDHQTLHLATRMYGDSPAWGYTIGYMKSTDFGQTWTHYDDTPITLPALKSTIDAIEMIDPEEQIEYHSGSALGGPSIAVDSNNVPHVLYNTLDEGGAVPRQAWLATPNQSGGWDKMLLNDKCDVLPSGWGLGMSGGIVFGDSGHMFITLTMASEDSLEELWANPTSEIVWMESSDGGQTFSSTILSDGDLTTPNWLASIERPTGFNSIDVPSLMYTAGTESAGNDVFWKKVAFIPGDANRDGRVDGADVAILANHWQAGVGDVDSSNVTWEMGDFNRDGQVDGSDVTILANHWQHGVTKPTTAVPESSIPVLILTGMIIAGAYLTLRNSRTISHRNG